MSKLPPLITRKKYIHETIKNKIKNYTDSFYHIGDEIELTLSNIKPIEIGGKEVYPDYIFLGRSSTDQKKMKLVRNLIQQPINKLIEKYDLINQYKFLSFTENYLPYVPNDRDYTLFTKTTINDKEKEKIKDYLQTNIPLIQNAPKAEFRIETLDSWKRILRTFPYEKPHRDHIKDIPFNSVILQSNNDPKINELLKNIKTKTGNPRTYEEFKIEVKEFQNAVEISPWF
ncbi:MAG: hypothetical protein KJ906_02925 [Nanoarchaeota archaeon]|nr:hypothetical protein [Nanoarchaeota archaeon]